MGLGGTGLVKKLHREIVHIVSWQEEMGEASTKRKKTTTNECIGSTSNMSNWAHRPRRWDCSEAWITSFISNCFASVWLQAPCLFRGWNVVLRGTAFAEHRRRACATVTVRILIETVPRISSLYSVRFFVYYKISFSSRRKCAFFQSRFALKWQGNTRSFGLIKPDSRPRNEVTRTC